ncbi:hypothetical protein GTA08_BOTSDO07409 [Botryosphaeria dothidea]|uniref:FAD-binding domain-containing protein n=1 Tax=Botryosphaeria dothidea TaxID=55169 RepID=A0A8H4IQC3_9PEZI|nr:hypothetical protein GTA08_BOTSDO07409 [Botryosphaeria dothidea]
MASNHFIIVGAGYVGLTAAIELTLKGFRVEVFEAAKEFTTAGDILFINPSVTGVLSKWGSTLKEVEEISSVQDKQTVYDWKGDVIVQQRQQLTRDGFPALISPRGYLHLAMYRYVVSIGVKIHFGTPITDVFEEDDVAGVYVDGKRFEASGVIATDGIHSKVRAKILKDESRPSSSGFAIYRSFFDIDRLLDDPKTRRFAEGDEDEISVWIGKDTHAVLLTDKNLGKIGAFLTHRDEQDVEESYTASGNLDHLLKFIEGWDESLRAVFRKAPADKLFGWKLFWRDPLSDWTSPKGRIVLAGDASHPHLPSSASGAMQAVEDGVTLGALADALGAQNVPDLFRTFRLIRSERTNLTQRLGWENRYKFHHTDWDAVKANPGWAKAYAYDNAKAALESVKSGSPFQNTNVPEGHRVQEWSINDLIQLEAK